MPTHKWRPKVRKGREGFKNIREAQLYIQDKGLTNAGIYAGNDERGEKLYDYPLDEVVVTAKRPYTAPTPWLYSSAFDGSYSNLYDTLDAMSGGFIGMTPILGDVLDAGKVGSDLSNKKYGEAAIGAGLLALPNFIEKPIKMIKRPVRKFIKGWLRLQMPWGEISSHRIRANELVNNMNYKALEAIRTVLPITDSEKKLFRLAYEDNSLAATPEQFVSWLHRYGEDGALLMSKNPNYADFVLKNKLDPNLLSSVDAFLEKLATSIRGVHADSEEVARKALTEHSLGMRRPGGDYMYTKGGLYSSNDTSIANSFKNPENGVLDGYIGILKSNLNIDKSKPLAELLLEYKNLILLHDLFPLHISRTKAREKGIKFVEHTYGSRGTRERATLPISSEVSPGAEIKELYHYPAQVNQRGRWNTGPQNKILEISEDLLFSPLKLNTTTDFIRNARLFLSNPKTAPDWDKINKFMKPIDTQRDRVYLLTDKLRHKKGKYERGVENAKTIGLWSSLLGGTTVGGILGVTSAMPTEEDNYRDYMNYINDDPERLQHFIKSHYYNPIDLMHLNTNLNILRSASEVSELTGKPLHDILNNKYMKFDYE